MSWVKVLSKGAAQDHLRPVDLADTEVTAWLDARPGPDMCGAMRRAAEKAAGVLGAFGDGGAHELARDKAWHILSLASEGHSGVHAALRAVEAAFKGSLYLRDDEERLARAEKEWQSIVSTGVRRRFSVETLSDCSCGDPGQADSFAENFAANGEVEQANRYRPVGPEEWAQPVEPMRWMIEGVWEENSYGALGAKEKSLKSYTAIAMMLSVASGKPMLGEFKVHQQGPVLMYIGEGGKKPFYRRLQKMAEAYGISMEELARLPLYPVFDVGSLNDLEFRSAFRRNLDEIQPTFVVVDSLYSYHPQGVAAQNLYERGPMLAELSNQTKDQASLLLADHFNKSSDALSLASFGYAGVGQWVNSWILQRHAKAPDLETGNFSIDCEIGSREWGGSRHSVSWHIPPGLDMGEGADQITFKVSKWQDRGKAIAAGLDSIESQIHKFIAVHPFKFTKKQVAEDTAITGRKADKVVAIDAMIESGELITKRIERQEGGRKVPRDLLGISNDAVSDA